MKYAIYDTVASGYLTKMEVEVGYSENTQFECGYNEYITEAQLLDTPKEAADAIVRIESFKFMYKGRFVMHSFDDTLKDHYIISEAGKPTKVVDNITVNIDGTIDVKHGTMVSHWSASSLEYAINRMNALQKAKDSRYTAWCNTFDIYKVINVIDEKSCTHYQFIKVTNKGLTEYAKDEVDPLNKRIEDLERSNNILTEDINYHNDCRLALVEMIRAIKYAICSKDGDKRDNYISYMTDKIKDNEIFNRPELKTAKNDIPKICKHLTALAKNPLDKRIEELEKANYDLGQQSLARGLQANRLKEENDDLKTKVEAIKKEASNWKNRYKTALRDCALLENVIDNIYDDLCSTDVCKNLNDTLNYVKDDIYSELNRIKILNDNTDDCDPIYISAATEFIFIINQIITIMESLELNQSVAFASADEAEKARNVAYDILAICEADDKFERTLEKFSQLHEAMGAVPNIDYDPIMRAFWGMLLIFSTMDHKLEDFVDELYEWKSKAQKAEKSLDDQKKLNDANKATIARMVVIKSTADKRIKELRDTRGSMAEVIFAIRNAICNNNNDAFRCINDRMLYDSVFNSDTFMAGVRENILDICNAYEKNITNWKRHAEEAISVYTRCNSALVEWKKKCKAKDADYEMLKNKLQACEVTLDSTHELLTKTTMERDKALERAEKFKGIANSVYGITVPGRCCGKQLMADILSGKKIPVNKEKYDDLVDCINNLTFTYEVFGHTIIPMDKPVWFDGIIKRIKNLTE